MFFLFILQLLTFSVFPLYFTMLEGPIRRVHFYIYISLLLLIGGFMGNVYSIKLSHDIIISGGNLCYGAFMMASVMFVWIEKDAFIIRNIVRIVIVVDLFNIANSYLIHKILTLRGSVNPHNVPPELFTISFPFIALGGVLIILELFLLLFIFENTKKITNSVLSTSFVYIASFIIVLLVDGIAFSFIAFGINYEMIAVVFGGLAGKALMAAAFSLPLALFILWRHQAFTDYLRSDTVRWRLLVSSSSELIKEMAEKDIDVRRGDIVFKNVTDGLAIVDLSGEVLKANCSFWRMLDKRGSVEEQFNIENSFWIDDRPFRLSAKPTNTWRGEVRFGDGLKQFGILSVTPAGEDLSGEKTFVYSLTDISDQKNAQHKLEYLATHDQLTGLPNRRVLDEELRAVSGKQHALIMIDLDHFKDINDSYGHIIGDRVLKVLAERLEALCMRFSDEQDILYHIGGDEFALLLHTNDKQAVERIVASMQSAFTQTIRINDGVEVFSTATFGVSFQVDGHIDDALLQADAALYEAKRNKRGTVGIYEDKLTIESHKQMKLGLKLKNALLNQAIDVYYQPQFFTHSKQLRGVEALARWTDPELGTISPNDFIPVAERSGLVDMLGEYVLGRVCRDGSMWLRNGFKPIMISVNISANQLRFGDFKSILTRILEQTGYPAHMLEIEITESSYIARESEVIPLLHALKTLGVSIAIDDFGTGYSSLSYLREMPLSAIKIDRSFITDIPRDEKQCGLTSAIIRLAKVMSFEIVAEGVENKEQLDFLTAEGCDIIQGYYFSQPVHSNDLKAIMLEEK